MDLSSFGFVEKNIIYILEVFIILDLLAFLLFSYHINYIFCANLVLIAKSQASNLNLLANI